MVCYDIGNEQEIGNNIWGHNDMEIVWVLYLCIFVSRCNFFVFLMANKLNVKASRLSSCDKMEIAHTSFSTSVYNLNKLGNQPQVLSREWISMVCFMYPTFQSVMRLLCLTAMCNGLTALWPSGARHGKHRFRQWLGAWKRQASIWTSADLFSIGPSGTSIRHINQNTNIFFQKIAFQMSSAK